MIYDLRIALSIWSEYKVQFTLSAKITYQKLPVYFQILKKMRISCE